MSDDHDTSNDTLVFWTHAGKLVDLASVSVMACLMHHKITLMQRRNKEIEVNTDEIDLIHATLPEPIIGKIRGVSRPMNVSLVKWWKYHWEQVFFRNMPSDDITLFDQLVWLHDGSISFEQTARKLLSSDKLTNMQKFQIACTYYFIDEVNRLKEMLSPDDLHLATESSCTIVEPFMEYWRCKIGHMTGPNFFTVTDVHFLIIELMKPSCTKYYVHWPVIEHFWNQSHNEEQRLSYANRMVIDQFLGGKKAELIWHLLPKLTSSLLDLVMKESGYHIMVCFANKPNYHEYTMLIWKRMVNLIDDVSLNCLLRALTDLRENQDYIRGLLQAMWFYLSEQQKKFVANQQQREFNYVAKWLEDGECNSPYYEMIVDIFSLWDSERRRQYWTANWTRLVIGQMGYKNKVEEVMKIFLGSDENIAVFKRAVMTDYNSIRTACENLLRSGHFEELQKYLNYCTSVSDQQVIQSLKKQIVTAMPKNKLFWVLYDCCMGKELDTEFVNLMSDILSVDEIKDFQKDVLMGNLEELEYVLLEESFHELTQFVEKYVSSEEDRYTIKLHFIKSSYNLYENMEMLDWVDFQCWCLNGDKSLAERFKISLQPAKAEVLHDVEIEQHSLYESFCNHFLSEM